MFGPNYQALRNMDARAEMARWLDRTSTRRLRVDAFFCLYHIHV
jgi:hypothetical protein